jgi:hypothetical protein
MECCLRVRFPPMQLRFTRDSGPRWVARRAGAAAVMALLVAGALLVGCAPKVTRVHIRDFQDPDAPRTLYQEFDEAYYRLDAAGSLQLVLRREVPSREVPAETIAQIIHVETFWEPKPGVTYAESSMVNATLTYLICSGRTGIAYQGNGFVSFAEDRRRQTLAGRIEAAELTPVAVRGRPPRPFGPAHLEGTFHAIRHPRRATAVLNEMKRTVQAFTPDAS